MPARSARSTTHLQRGRGAATRALWAVLVTLLLSAGLLTASAGADASTSSHHQTRAPRPATTAAAVVARRADKDCSDFAGQAAAQHYFIDHGGPRSDPSGLDADHDGVLVLDEYRRRR